MTFDGSAIDGFSRVQESDVLAKPDPARSRSSRWRTDDIAVARVFCDVLHLDGTPFAGDPRHVLRRQLEKARELGFTFFAAPELEYFYFGGGDPARPLAPLDRGSYFEMTVADLGSRASPARRCSRSRTWASRSSTPSTRTRRASTRSTSATPTR